MPVEDEMNWAVPQKRPGHAANVSQDLLETANFIWHPNLPSQSVHIVSKFLGLQSASDVNLFVFIPPVMRRIVLKFAKIPLRIRDGGVGLQSRFLFTFSIQLANRPQLRR